MAAFTAIAAGVSLAATLAGTGMSFHQASKARQDQDEAEAAAEKAMKEARSKLDINFYEQLSVQKTPYELEREALLVQGADVLQQAQESGVRGVAGTSGRVLAAQQKGQQAITKRMGKEMSDLELLQAKEDSRLRDIEAQLHLAEASGAQQAAADAQKLQAQSMQQGMEGVTSFASQAAAAAPLYAKTGAVRQGDRLQRTFDRQQSKAGLAGGEAALQAHIAGLGNVGGVDLSGVGGMESPAFQDWMGQQSPKFIKSLRKNLGGINAAPASTGLTLDEKRARYDDTLYNDSMNKWYEENIGWEDISNLGVGGS